MKKKMALERICIPFRHSLWGSGKAVHSTIPATRRLGSRGALLEEHVELRPNIWSLEKRRLSRCCQTFTLPHFSSPIILIFSFADLQFELFPIIFHTAWNSVLRSVLLHPSAQPIPPAFWHEGAEHAKALCAFKPRCSGFATHCCFQSLQMLMFFP